jgi:cyclopropane fatty-acyl-phospholipid synthase-like methyltransferase
LHSCPKFTVCLDKHRIYSCCTWENATMHLK